jgi:hypothetical protein
MAKAAVSKRAPTTRKQPARTMTVTVTPVLSHEQIAERAFSLYQSRGHDDGHDVNDWFEAERQLRSA